MRQTYINMYQRNGRQKRGIPLESLGLAWLHEETSREILHFPFERYEKELPSSALKHTHHRARTS